MIKPEKLLWSENWEKSKYGKNLKNCKNVNVSLFLTFWQKVSKNKINWQKVFFFFI